MSEPASGRIGVPGAGRPAETDRLLKGVEDDLDTLDQLVTADQVPVYDGMHSTLADALARTADTGGPPAPGETGA
jgi:hypothetical protein